ncbi:EAL domain-containing protein [Granulicella tundricola]|uniref:EAL domain-containing protein n=1 Tax=Granulicella tundricola TaxID=940615 RepID=UPI0001DB7CC3|nr:EAL domain-containing protein [Granulicella tundricola]
MTRRKRLDLSSALARGEFVPYFQPLVDLRTGELRGCEVLARWVHPTRGIVLPDDFIPYAEESGIIAALSECVLSKAFEACATLNQTFVLSVNISPIQFRDPILSKRLSELSTRHRFPLDRVKVEITESTLLTNLADAQSISTQLKLLGVKLSLDDFGTGYSSLAHLQALPFDEIKIDRSFVSSMCCRRESMKIVAAVIGLGRSLGLTTVAEGIEESAQADMLRCLGCEVGQGWFYGRPVPIEELQAMLALSRPSSHRVGHTKQVPKQRITSFLEALPAARHAQLQAIYDGSPVGLCFVDRELRYVSVNQRHAQMNGAPAEAHLGRTVREMVPEPFYEKVVPYLTRALGGEAIHGVELERRDHIKGVKCATILSTYQPAQDENGEVIGVSVTVVDISDRKAAERALAESEDHFRHMVQLNPQIPYTMDPNGLILDMSPRWAELTGLTFEETCGRGWLRTVHPEDATTLVSKCLAAIKAAVQIDVEFRVLGRDKLWHWMRSRAAPRMDRDGAIIKWYGSVELIDDQKQAQEQLWASQLRLQTIIDTLPVGVVIAEAPSGRIIGRNQKAEAILQQDPLHFEQIGDYSRRVAYHRDGRRLESDDFPLAKAILRGQITDAEHVYYTFGDDVGKWLSLSGAPLKDRDGKIVGAVATIQELNGETSHLI